MLFIKIWIRFWSPSHFHSLPDLTSACLVWLPSQAQLVLLLVFLISYTFSLSLWQFRKSLLCHGTLLTRLSHLIRPGLSFILPRHEPVTYHICITYLPRLFPPLWEEVESQNQWQVTYSKPGDWWLTKWKNVERIEIKSGEFPITRPTH